jgi:hypothetical protein
LSIGCIKAPDVVIVDRHTSLEQQAAGSFRGLEEELEQAAIAPAPTPLTAAQLQAAGVGKTPGAEEVDDDEGLPDALRADQLLVQRCVGETSGGTLALTIESCTGTIDVPSVNRLIERVNRNRRQLWQWLAEKAPGRTEKDAQVAWREVHLAGLVCGGQFQNASGAWEVKRCSP